MYRIMLLVMAVALVMAAGCAKKQVEAEGEPTQETTVVEEPKQDSATTVVEYDTKAPTPEEMYAAAYANLPTRHTVKKGECLWWIAEYVQIYNDPFMWPLIYKANRGQINNPNLIYPGQVFDIPREGMSLREVMSARKMAGAGMSAPSETAVLPVSLRKELGFSF
jgi:nucleoid-associated protein YgaU